MPLYSCARLALALLTIGSIGAGLTACGGSSTVARRSSHASPGAGANTTTTVSNTASATATVPRGATVPPAPAIVEPDSDRDSDGNAPDEQSNATALDFGQKANPSDARRVTELVKRYYAAGLAGDGAKACAMLSTTLAEAVVEDYGQAPAGPAYMLGAKSCAEAMGLLFRHFHAQLALEVPKLEVTRVRLEEHHGFALLRFGRLPEREIPVTREGHIWKIAGIYDTELP